MTKAYPAEARSRGQKRVQGRVCSGTAEIDAAGLETRELNDHLRDLMLAGTEKAVLKDVCGQRYIGTRLYSPEHRKMEIEIFGTPGNDLGAFLFGHKIRVHGNAQDGVGNTMDDGEIVIEGRAGDVTGFSMRGGKIFVRENVGYRTALHMKEYNEKRPVMVIGGTSQDFLGEYMAGGIVILLGLHGKPHKGNFIGNGMHGGVIYLRGSVDKTQVGGQVDISPPDEADREIIERYVSEFIERFPEIGLDKEQILNSDFVRLSPRSKRPYGKLYAY
ncbi:MAG: Molybdenum-containing formylmethanofuran dehydrogenase 1 subunit C [Methanosaeta sp. PtaU1.Bin060]|jgi:glutamate synthase domain-containing protein 3|nr:MAG: Molybdenum-containing formylmethanofuran dehydrogenase 1 subunit C [Methanosaeta sp. PtaU1.Bin060]